MLSIRLSFFYRLSVLLAATLLVPACKSPRSGERGPPPPPQIPLFAETTYLDGAILVRAEFGPAAFHGPSGEAQEERSSARPSRSEHPERGAGGEGRGGGGRGRGQNTAPPNDGDTGAVRARASVGGAMRGPIRQALSITLTNTSDQPVHLRIAEVKSILGNIVPEPETFTLQPGGEQTLSPMRAGIRESVTEFHVTIRLRTVDANETQTLVLKPDGPPEA